ncbi:MAG: hypothetical protein WD510_03900 [Balneolaceae bacterium]
MLRNCFHSVNTLGIGLFLGFMACLGSCVLPLQAQNVVIEGTVILERPQSAPGRVNIGGYQSLTPGSASSEAGTASDHILVWLVNNDQEASYVARDTALQVLDQVNKRFRPRLMAVRVGDSVRIQNSDPVYHNVFSLSKTKRFDVGRRSPKDYEDVEFNRVGSVDVFCDLHSNMHAVIRVLPEQTVHWIKLEGSGRFRFEDIPKGEYTVYFFAIGSSEAKIEVPATDEMTDIITLETIRLGGRL